MDSSIDNLKGEVEFFIKVFHQMRNAFLPTVLFLAIGALVFRRAKASVTFVCKSCLTSAIMLAWSLSTSILM